MFLHTLDMFPNIGTIAEGYNTYLYYMEGDVLSALITGGVVVLSGIGDYLVKDIVGATIFTFSQNARSRLEAMPDTEISHTTRIIVSGYLDDLAAKGGIVDEVIDGTGKILHKATSGVDLLPNPNKTTTILGRYDEDMKFIIDDLKIKDVYVDGLSPNVGGFNVLNITKEYDYAKFWDMYNKPFIDAALTRGDDILLATKVTPNAIYKNPTLGNPNTWDNLTGFGREIEYLINNGYELASDAVTLIKNKG